MNEKAMKALKSWRVLNADLNTLNEKDVLDMLEHELQHENRKSFVERLHQRYSALRSEREREKLMESFKGA
jgi:hypothetical protein